MRYLAEANLQSGLSVHMNQVHKETLTSVENALGNRAGLDVEIFGMEGIPEDVAQAHNQRIITQFYQAEAERRAATGNPGPGGSGGGGASKKPKFESPAELKKRLAEHKARMAEQAAGGGSSGGNTPQQSGQSPALAQSPGGFVSRSHISTLHIQVFTNSTRMVRPTLLPQLLTTVRKVLIMARTLKNHTRNLRPHTSHRTLSNRRFHHRLLSILPRNSNPLNSFLPNSHFLQQDTHRRPFSLVLCHMVQDLLRYLTMAIKHLPPTVLHRVCCQTDLRVSRKHLVYRNGQSSARLLLSLKRHNHVVQIRVRPVHGAVMDGMDQVKIQLCHQLILILRIITGIMGLTLHLLMNSFLGLLDQQMTLTK